MFDTEVDMLNFRTFSRKIIDIIFELHFDLLKLRIINIIGTIKLRGFGLFNVSGKRDNLELATSSSREKLLLNIL